MRGAEPDRQFIDSNVLVYAFDRTAGRKNERARELLEALWSSGGGCLSMQILQEFFVTVTGRIPKPLSHEEAVRRVAHYSEWHVHEPGRRDLLAAIDLRRGLRISFWDAMVVHSAKRMDCSVLWTEDLNDGQRYGGVLARNPFVDLVMD
jgi:predicted nucleic acid-binding protein